MVIIDPYRGGSDIGYSSNNVSEKDFNLKISKYISNRLNDLGINNVLTRDNDNNLNINERSNIINSYSNDPKTIVISNRLNYGDENGVEILYSLKNSDSSANKLSNAFTERDIYVNKVYQRRDENDTSRDYDDLLKNINNIETIIINYGYINNKNDIENVISNYEKYAESVIKFISTQMGVPYSYDTSNEYIVKKGDSLWSISKKYNISVDELKNYNNLKTNIININQVLKIPSVDISNSYDTYTVTKGDSLWGISRKYGITVDELKSINNLNSNIINVGMVLKIPSKNSYIVKKGDSLWSISKKFNTTVDKLKKNNNLTNNIINIGQKLIIS